MITPWKILNKKTYKHSPFRSIEDILFELPNGTEQTFSLKKEGQVVAILALDKSNQVILTKQFRPGPNRVLDELPGGGVERDESPLDAAKRELKEETGYESSNWTKLGTPLECAYSTITRHAYLATDCHKTSGLDLDETEFIEVVLKDLNSFFTQAQAGDCTDPEVAWMGLFKLGYLKRNS